MAESKETKETNLMEIYNKVREVPKEAQKTIRGGRLKGMTDINPMWRIKTLTEQFGPCGFGWKYVITKQWLENGTNGEISAFTNIDLFVKLNGVWSEPIPGTGGSTFVASESKGLYTSDECFKMSLTDAISVACKSLGFAADIYWASDRTKYDLDGDSVPLAEPEIEYITEQQKEKFKELGIAEKAACVYCKVDTIDKITKAQAQAMIVAKEKRIK